MRFSAVMLHFGICAASLVLSTSFPVFAQTAPAGINVTGTLLNADGTPIVQANVAFKLELYDKDAKCVLYSEEHLGQDLSESSGLFSLNLGGGSSATNHLQGGSGFSPGLFVNNATTSTPSGCGQSVTFNAGDERLIRVYYNVGSGYVAMTPDVPMVSSAAEAAEVVEAVRYPPRGRRGVGSALARSARWNRVDGYLENADDHISLFVQVETIEGAAAAAEIAAVDGIDGVFVGPSDLAASMGLLGQQTHPDVTGAVLRAFDAVRGAGKPVGVNAFDPEAAQAYVDAGAGFVLVGADVAILARSSEVLAARWVDGEGHSGRASY